MSFWKALFKKPNGVDELEPLKEEFSNGVRRVQEAAKKLARSAETISRHKKESEFAEEIARYRSQGII